MEIQISIIDFSFFFKEYAWWNAISFQCTFVFTCKQPCKYVSHNCFIKLMFTPQCNSSLLSDSSYSQLLVRHKAAQYSDRFLSNGGDIGTHGSDWQHLYLVQALPKLWGSIIAMFVIWKFCNNNSVLNRLLPQIIARPLLSSSQVWIPVEQIKTSPNLKLRTLWQAKLAEAIITPIISDTLYLYW